MRIYSRLLFSSLFLVFLFAAATSAVCGELIKPTRTLQSSEKTPGNISVFSEPPGLDVLLDDINIGKTPVIAKQVTPGTHVLRVKETEKEITILPETSLRISLFKNSLIEIPEKKAEAPTQPKLEEKSATEEKKAEDSNKDKKNHDPFYWPMNPGGPIR